jgi:DNA-binding transcriptional MerR regulator
VFRIGDFSRIARVSCRLLRYYDEIGLLKPATTDRDTGYRYYSAAQLPALNRILVLKELGLSLEEIVLVVHEEVNNSDLKQMLLTRRAALEHSLQLERERLRHLETRIAQIETSGMLVADDVVIRADPAQFFMSARATVPSFSAARELIARVVRRARKSMPPEGLGPLLAIAHAPEFEPDRLDVEIGYLLARASDETIEDGDLVLRVRELPATARLATCVRVGLPEQAHLITGKIGAFVEANGYRLAGPSRELFLQPPRLERMEESVVEMQFPIAKEGE